MHFSTLTAFLLPLLLPAALAAPAPTSANGGLAARDCNYSGPVSSWSTACYDEFQDQWGLTDDDMPTDADGDGEPVDGPDDF